MNDFRQHFDKVCADRGVKASELISESLQTFEGQKLLEALQLAAQPLDHTFHPDARFQAHHHGRLEVISLLWLYGTAQRLPALPTPNTHDQT